MQTRSTRYTDPRLLNTYTHVRQRSPPRDLWREEKRVSVQCACALHDFLDAVQAHMRDHLAHGSISLRCAL